jgi:hypothetical protein
MRREMCSTEDYGLIRLKLMRDDKLMGLASAAFLQPRAASTVYRVIDLVSEMQRLPRSFYAIVDAATEP